MFKMKLYENLQRKLEKLALFDFIHFKLENIPHLEVERLPNKYIIVIEIVFNNTFHLISLA